MSSQAPSLLSLSFPAQANPRYILAKSQPLLPYLFCLGVAISFTWRIVFLGQQPFLGDIQAQFLPWKEYARRSLAQGRIPLWNPYTYGGCPFLANFQSAVFYPIDLFLSCFPIRYHFGWSLIIHLVLSMWLMLLLGASCGLSGWARCLAACAYGLNGFVMIHIPFGNHLTYTAIAWSPGLIWAAHRALRADRLRAGNCSVFAFLIALQLLCGHPQMAFYAYSFTGLFILAAGAGLDWKRVAGASCAFAIGGVIAAGLCAFQIIPTLEYIPHSVRRSAIDFNQATEFSFAPHRLISLWAGEYFGSHIWGNHWDAFYYWSSAYGGAILPVLAVIGATRRRAGWWLWRGLLVMGITALFLACGRDNPMYQYVLMLPGFGYFRAPAKFLPWLVLPISLFGGRGLDLLRCHLQRLPEPARLGRHPSFAAATIFGGLAGVFLVARFLGHQSARTPEIVRLAALFVALGYSAVGVALYLAGRQFPLLRGRLFPAGMLLILMVDLWLFGYKYIHASLVPADRVWRWLAPAPEAILLHQAEKNQGPFRVAMIGQMPYPNLTIPWQLRGLGGYDPISLQATMDLFAASEGWPEELFVDSVELKRADSPIYDLFAVQYLLSPDELSGPGLELVDRGRYLRIYKRKNRPPIARWVSEDEAIYRPPSTPPRTREELMRLRWDRIEIDAAPPAGPKQEPSGGEAEEAGTVEVLAWQEQDLVLRCAAPRDGWLVFSVPWHPGWVARIDGGKNQPCVRAMQALSAIRVPTGEHEVTISFEPASWRLGCRISLSTLLAVAVSAIWITTKEKRAKRTH